jgi:hypothetical protein
MKSTIKRTYKKRKMNKSYRKNKRGGSCGCQQNQQKGGSANFFGPDSFAKFDATTNNYTYPLNSHINDPLNPTNIVSVRMQPNMVGGKSRKNKSKKSKKSKKSNKKMRGGGLPGGGLPGGGLQGGDGILSSNLQSSVFTSEGAATQVNVLGGVVNPSLNQNMSSIQSFAKTSMPLI